MRQQQFLEVLDRDEAERRWREVIDVAPLPTEGGPGQIGGTGGFAPLLFTVFCDVFIF